MDSNHQASAKTDLTSVVVQGIANLNDLDRIADRLGETLGQRYQLSFFGFSLWDAKRRVFVERVTIPPGAQPVHLGIEDLDDYGFGIALKAGTPRLVTDIELEGLREGEWRARETFGTRSYITLPIHVRGRVAGALGLGSSQPGAFDADDIQLLRPIALVLGLKAGELGSSLPMHIEKPVSVLPGPVLLAGTDERLKRRVLKILPQALDIRRDESWTGRGSAIQAPSLTLFCTTQLGPREAHRILERLGSLPGRMVIICRKAKPEAAFWILGEGASHGLLAIEYEQGSSTALPGNKSFVARLSRWIFQDAASVEWEALGFSLAGGDERFLRVTEALERDPFRNWTVGELADHTAMSRSTLGRVVRAATGRSPRDLIRDFRFHIIDRFLRSGEISGSQLYPLFGFSSVQRLAEWRRRYRPPQ